MTRKLGNIADMTISILGSGWLGFPLSQSIRNLGHAVKLSTRSADRLSLLASASTFSYVINIDNLADNIHDFLASDILIINITSKNYQSFINLIEKIEQSTVKKVLFISSTSVYRAENAVVSEDTGMESFDSILFQIEQLFRLNSHFETTVLRLSGLIGYTRHPGRFFKHGKIVQQADTPVNLIHRDDCIGIIQSIIKQDAWNQAFNGCATTHPTKREFYSHARKLLSMPEPDFSSESEPVSHRARERITPSMA